MRPITEWCGVCLQDDLKVIAVQVIEQVPLCKGCVVAYGQEKEVLRDARQFLRDMDDDEPKKSAPEYFTPDPKPPAVKHFCVCGCGTVIPEGQRLADGHNEKAPTPTPASSKREPDKPLTDTQKRELMATPIVAKKTARCGTCGKEYSIGKNARGRYCNRDCYNAKQREATSVVKNVTNTKICKCGCGAEYQPTSNAQQVIKGNKLPLVRQEVLAPAISLPPVVAAPRTTHEVSIERSRTTVTVREKAGGDAISLGRKVNLIIPNAKPTSQVRLTPDIAQAVWRSLSIEEKFKLIDVEGMWQDFDDWTRMACVSKVLLVAD